MPENIPGATPDAPYGFLKSGQPRKRRSSEDVRMQRVPDTVYVKNESALYKQRAHQRKPVMYDYLKYHRIVFAWARQNYKVSTIEIEMMLFLYSEKVFTKTKFKEYSMIMPFDRRKLERMIYHGWVQTWRNDTDHRYKTYELSQKAKRLVNSIYKKLEGEEKISELESSNILMDKTNSKTKMYSVAIKKLNKATDSENMKARHPTRTDWKPNRLRKDKRNNDE